MKLSIAIGLVALCGCSVAGQLGGRAPGCDLQVSFEAPLAEAGARAVERVNAATGCQVRIADDGVPVNIGTDLEGENGARACAQTWILRYPDGMVDVESIEIDPEMGPCMSVESSIIHEMFHAMLAVKGLHASDGVFHAKAGNGELINAATLECVCTHMVCPSFVPETGSGAGSGSGF